MWGLMQERRGFFFSPPYKKKKNLSILFFIHFVPFSLITFPGRPETTAEEGPARQRLAEITQAGSSEAGLLRRKPQGARRASFLRTESQLYNLRFSLPTPQPFFGEGDSGAQKAPIRSDC